MPYHCTVYLVRVRNDHNLPQGRKFLFDCVVVVGGGSEGEVTQVEVVEVGGGRENLANLDKKMYHSIFPVAIYVLKKADKPKR